MSKTVYLASPYGFSAMQRTLLIPPLVGTLEGLGLQVWEPFERNNNVDRSKRYWAYDVQQGDLRDCEAADGIVAIVNGNPPDEGVMVELGIAIALRKPTFLFRDDYRNSADSGEYPLNLMIFAGLPRDDWERYYYTSLPELADPRKALVQWATS